MRRKQPRPFVSSGAYSSELVVNGAAVGATRDDGGWFLARVAGAVTGGFTFVEQWVDASGAVADKDEGRANSASDPAVAVNGATPATGDKVLIRRAPGGAGGWWELAPVGGGIRGVTVAEVDGSPSYADVTAIRFDQADGFVVSQPAAGIARVDIASASATQSGIVDTASQAFAGQKQFLDGAIVGPANQPYRPSVSTSGIRVEGLTETVSLQVYPKPELYGDPLVSVVQGSVTLGATPFHPGGGGSLVPQLVIGDASGDGTNATTVAFQNNMCVKVAPARSSSAAGWLRIGQYVDLRVHEFGTGVEHTGVASTTASSLRADSKFVKGVLVDLGSGAALGGMADPGNGLAAGSYP